MYDTVMYACDSEVLLEASDGRSQPVRLAELEQSELLLLLWVSSCGDRAALLLRRRCLLQLLERHLAQPAVEEQTCQHPARSAFPPGISNSLGQVIPDDRHAQQRHKLHPPGEERHRDCGDLEQAREHVKSGVEGRERAAGMTLWKRLGARGEPEVQRALPGIVARQAVSLKVLCSNADKLQAMCRCRLRRGPGPCRPFSACEACLSAVASSFPPSLVRVAQRGGVGPGFIPIFSFTAALPYLQSHNPVSIGLGLGRATVHEERGIVRGTHLRAMLRNIGTRRMLASPKLRESQGITVVGLKKDMIGLRGREKLRRHLREVVSSLPSRSSSGSHETFPRR